MLVFPTRWFPALVLLATVALRASDAPEAVVIGFREFPVANPIDGFILDRLHDEKREPSGLCTDAEFLRRAYLDVCGVIPSGEQARSFLDDRDPHKRAKLIDKLLENPHYAGHWEVMWGDLLREHSNSRRKEGTVQGSYREWLRGALQANMPYDQFARALITASGDAETNGAANFYLRDQQDRTESSNTVSQVFMGTQLACAQCHDHPFDKWTQDDFQHLMAFFARVDVSKPGNKKKMGNPISHVSERSSGEYHMAEAGAKKKSLDGEVFPAVFPWDVRQKSSGEGSRRVALADFVTSSRRFAAVQANRLWAQLMGRGLVDPPDDFRPKNPPSHPELLEYLTDEFIRSKFDNKHVLRLILNSSAYQRSSAPNQTNRSDMELFSHQRVRRMSGEEVFDSILVATGYEQGMKDLPGLVSEESAKKKGNKNKNLPSVKKPVEWAADLPTPAKLGSFMNLFNQPKRDVVAVKRDDSGSISQALEMLNGNALNDAVKDSELGDALFASKAGGEKILTDLYLAVLSRYPTPPELALASRYDSTRVWIEDVHWALLNSREFTFVK